MDTEHLHRHICPDNLSQLFVRQTQVWPFYPKGRRGLSRLEAPSCAKDPITPRSLASSLGASQAPKASTLECWVPSSQARPWAPAASVNSPGGSEEDPCFTHHTVALSTATEFILFVITFLFWYNINFTERSQELCKKNLISLYPDSPIVYIVYICFIISLILSFLKFF